MGKCGVHRWHSWPHTFPMRLPVQISSLTVRYESYFAAMHLSVSCALHPPHVTLCNVLPRSALAKALQSPSAAHLGLAPLLLGTPTAAAALLEACAEAARPAVEEQLRNMAAVLQQQQQQQEQLQGGGGAAAAVGVGLDPWDVAYAQQQLLAQACPLLAKGSDLLRHITLKGVLQVRPGSRKLGVSAATARRSPFIAGIVQKPLLYPLCPYS